MQKMHIANSDKPVNTKTTSKQLQLDSKKYQAQYNNLKIKKSNNYHDRFLIIDKTQAYQVQSLAQFLHYHKLRYHSS
jgi:hypothetical protein